MDVLSNVVQTVLGMGSSVVLPIIIFTLAIVFRVKVKDAIVAGMTVGIGMIGIGLVTGLLGNSVGPAAQAMVERMGLNLTIIDAGWPAVSAATWAQPIAAVMIPVILVVNLIMLAMNWTKTLNIDIWNYWPDNCCWYYSLISCLERSKHFFTNLESALLLVLFPSRFVAPFFICCQQVEI